MLKVKVYFDIMNTKILHDKLEQKVFPQSHLN